MINTFNPSIANTYGLNIATFLQSIAQWSYVNLANKTHIYDGHAWSYNTLEAFDQFFGWWTRRQIERIVNTAVQEGLLIKGNYNKHKYDRTCWYALTPKGMAFFPELKSIKNLETLYESISPNGEMLFAEWCEAVHQTVTPIPTINTTKENNNIGTSKDEPTNETTPKNKSKPKAPGSSKGMAIMTANNPHNIDESTLQDWVEVRRVKRAPITATAWDDILEKLDRCQKHGLKPKECFSKMVSAGWQTFEVEWLLNKDKSSQGKPNKETDVSYI